MGDRMDELESAMQALQVPPEAVERVRKAVRDGLSPATIQNVRASGIPADVVNLALAASEEYQESLLTHEAAEPEPATEPRVEPEPIEPEPPPGGGEEVG